MHISIVVTSPIHVGPLRAIVRGTRASGQDGRPPFTAEALVDEGRAGFDLEPGAIVTDVEVVRADGVVVATRSVKQHEQQDGTIEVEISATAGTADGLVARAPRTVRASVIDHRAIGIPDVEVVATIDDTEIGRVRTDETGSWALQLPARPVTLRIRAEEYDDSFVLETGEPVPTVRLEHLVVVDDPDAEAALPPRPRDAKTWATSDGVSQDLGDGRSLWVPDRSVEVSELATLVRVQEPVLAVPQRAVELGLARGGGPASAHPPAGAEARVSGGVAPGEDAPVAQASAKGGRGATKGASDEDPGPAETAGALSWAVLAPWVAASAGGAARPGSALAGLAPSVQADSVDSLRPAETIARLAQHHPAVADGSISRTPLGPERLLDIDSSDRAAATTVSLAHVLRHRQEWRADGYSLGTLLYSLPLAPGQRKQVAIVDWRRRDAGTRQDEAHADDRLSAETQQQRDIEEMVRSAAEESMSGSSTSTSVGVGVGSGAGATGSANGVGLSAMLGFSGGVGHASTEAQQTALREISGRSSQRVREATRQSATAVRSRRTTTVQAVEQSESAHATTEVVANHNHSHALTMQYFEVLRHLVVESRLHAVDEALLIPAPVIRWTPQAIARHEHVLRTTLRASHLTRGIKAVLDGLDGSAATRAVDRPLGLVTGRLRLRPDTVESTDQAPGSAAQRWTRLGLPFDAPLRLSGSLVVTRSDGGTETTELQLDELEPDGDGELVAQLRAPIAASRRSVAAISLRLDRSAWDALARLRVDALSWSADGATRPLTAPSTVRAGSASTVALVGDADLADSDASTRASAAARLLRHLDVRALAYSKAVWASLDADARFLALDRVLAPGLSGRRASLASVVENRLLGFVGNSWVMPVSAGLDLSAAVLGRSMVDCRADYLSDAHVDVDRVTVPTAGVFAEAVLGTSNASELIDDRRFWKWHEAPIPEGPEIAPVSTDSRSAPMDLRSTALDAAAVGLPGLSSLPSPTGLHDALAAVATASIFRDITGVDATARNAASALETTVNAAKELGEKAGENATEAYKTAVESQATERRLEQIEAARRRGTITDKQASALTTQALGGAAPASGGGSAGSGASAAPGQGAGGTGGADGSPGAGGTAGADGTAGTDGAPGRTGDTHPPRPAPRRRAIRRTPAAPPVDGEIRLKAAPRTLETRIALEGHSSVLGTERFGRWVLRTRVGHLTNGALVPLSVRVTPELEGIAASSLQSLPEVQSHLLRIDGRFALEVDVTEKVSTHPLQSTGGFGLELGLDFWMSRVRALAGGEGGSSGQDPGGSGGPSLSITHSAVETTQTTTQWTRNYRYGVQADSIVRWSTGSTDIGPEHLRLAGTRVGGVPITEWGLHTFTVRA